MIHSVEFFHLALLEVLQIRLDQACYVVNGGASLRYFYGSPRYSEDIDFDAIGIARWKLEPKVDSVLVSRPLALTLRTKGLAISEVAKPKQTSTTQRWKLALRLAGQSEPIRTRIEFSHRAADTRYQLDQVALEIVEPYALRPPTVNRYLPPAMIEQEIEALAERSETQARDVFDLDLLLRQWPTAVTSDSGLVRRLDPAIERVHALPFENYESLVIRFLDPGVAELYNRPEHWKQMQNRVAGALMALR
ncbi:MAG: nucleotidyl transferase AbiEii/AbiGii toxin family protein [bacterium]